MDPKVVEEMPHNCFMHTFPNMFNDSVKKLKSSVIDVRGKFNKQVTNRDLKETNGDNDIQTAFIFQCNLQTNLNTCLTVSLAPGNLCRKILVVAV